MREWEPLPDTDRCRKRLKGTEFLEPSYRALMVLISLLFTFNNRSMFHNPSLDSDSVELLFENDNFVVKSFTMVKMLLD